MPLVGQPYRLFIVPHDDVTEFYIKQIVERIRTRLKEMYKRFMVDREPENQEEKK